MIAKIKGIVNTDNKKKLLSSFYFLTVLQMANLILPLLTLPYLVRVLGVDYFGLLAFATAITFNFNILTDYGFNLTATREISIHRENKEKITEIFSSVMILKVVFMFLSLVILSLLVIVFEKFSKDWEIYFLTFGTVVGQVLFPVWFFQGMEKMKYITYLSVTAKVVFTLAIFVFVHEKSDYYLVPLLNSIGIILAGIWSLVLIKKDFNVKFRFQKMMKLNYYLKSGWHIFLSQVNVSLLGNSSIIILGFVANNVAVGYYSAAEKIIRAVAMTQVPITRALFPHIAKLIKSNKNQTFVQLKKVSFVGGFIYLIISIIIMFLSGYIVETLYGNTLSESILILKILAIIPLAIFLNNIFGTQIMLNTHKEKEFAHILFIAALVNVVSCYTLSYYFSYIGTAISLLIVEMYIVLAMFVSVKKELF